MSRRAASRSAPRHACYLAAHPSFTSDRQGAQLCAMDRKLPLIEVGFQVFATGEAEEFGAVREVLPGGRPQIVVDIENSGDHMIPLSAVTAVTEQKVIVDRSEEHTSELQ